MAIGELVYGESHNRLTWLDIVLIIAGSALSNRHGARGAYGSAK
ncbi:drug/metabolite transporter (DMT)-like permease [Rhizobium sp. BK313]|nr:hypothetical protein [Rhizobium sp. BK313]MBB3458811.1 drug/metabolite transporter (DMT)-like permease [Rhizobium sp. BK313]